MYRRLLMYPKYVQTIDARPFPSFLSRWPSLVTPPYVTSCPTLCYPLTHTTSHRYPRLSSVYCSTSPSLDFRHRCLQPRGFVHRRPLLIQPSLPSLPCFPTSQLSVPHSLLVIRFLISHFYFNQSQSHGIT